MIYKVHKPSDPYANRGQFIGYINLCQGYIDQRHVYIELIKAKLIHEEFRINDLVIAGAHSGTSANAYNIFKKRRPRPAPANPNELIVDRHEPLFYLHPLESLDKESKKDHMWIFSGDLGVSASTYNVAYPVVQNIAAPLAAVAPVNNPTPNQNRR
jgi:hypothetical protein